MNKNKFLAPLFIAASFLIVGCSAKEIVARPGWIDSPIVNGDFKDNKLKEIYDAIKELGDTNANVLNKVMYDIAKNQIGTFDELKTFKNANANADDFKDFVDKHDMYKPDEKSGVIVEGEVVVKDLKDLDEDQKNQISRDKITQQYDTILERVFEKMYNEVKGESYTTDSINKLFSEEEYVRHLKKELYAPVIPTPLPSDFYDGKRVFTEKPIGLTWKEFVNDDNTVSTTSGYLHIMEGENFTERYYPQTEGEGGGYIGRKVLPEIYREVLIEKYVREQRFTNLGRAYARKVQMIKIPHSSSEIDIKVINMLKYYAKKHITGDGISKATYGSLDDLSKAMIGIADTNATITSNTPRDYLVNGGKFSPIMIPNQSGTPTPLIWKMSIDTLGEATNTGVTTYVYKGTKLGDMVEKLMKAYDLVAVDTPVAGQANFTKYLKYPLDDDGKAAYEDFTNKEAYPVSFGITLKEREMLSTDLTQDGWFLKNGGLTDLNDEFRDNLFNITTSNIVDDKTWMETDDKGWGKYKSGNTARYFDTADATSNPVQHAYIVDKNSKASEPWNSVVLTDKETNSYIVQIDEAASLAKLSLDDTRSYIRSKATEIITDSNRLTNEIVQQVTKQVASSDTYKKNAEQYYLMISNILFYDESVYNYFKSQFPELFK